MEIVLFAISAFLVLAGISTLFRKKPLFIAGSQKLLGRKHKLSGLLLAFAGSLFFVATFYMSSNPQLAVVSFIIGLGLSIGLEVIVQNQT